MILEILQTWKEFIETAVHDSKERLDSSACPTDSDRTIRIDSSTKSFSKLCLKRFNTYGNVSIYPSFHLIPVNLSDIKTVKRLTDFEINFFSLNYVNNMIYQNCQNTQEMLSKFEEFDSNFNILSNLSTIKDQIDYKSTFKSRKNQIIPDIKLMQHYLQYIMICFDDSIKLKSLIRQNEELICKNIATQYLMNIWTNLSCEKILKFHNLQNQNQIFQNEICQKTNEIEEKSKKISKWKLLYHELNQMKSNLDKENLQLKQKYSLNEEKLLDQNKLKIIIKDYSNKIKELEIKNDNFLKIIHDFEKQVRELILDKSSHEDVINILNKNFFSIISLLKPLRKDLEIVILILEKASNNDNDKDKHAYLQNLSNNEILLKLFIQNKAKLQIEKFNLSKDDTVDLGTMLIRQNIIEADLPKNEMENILQIIDSILVLKTSASHFDRLGNNFLTNCSL
jgi:hypothetical protein